MQLKACLHHDPRKSHLRLTKAERGRLDSLTVSRFLVNVDLSPPGQVSPQETCVFICEIKASNPEVNSS